MVQTEGGRDVAYLTKGFVMDDVRLKNPDTWAEHDNVGEEPTLLQWGENR